MFTILSNPDPQNKIWFWAWNNISRMPPLFQSQWQLYRLRYLLYHHFTANPFYQNILKNNGFNIENIKNLNWNAFKKIPILNKDALRVYPLEECIAKNIHRSRFKERSTSGSTGNPFTFWVDQKYEKNFQRIFSKVWRRAGCEKDLRIALIQVILQKKDYFGNRMYIPGLNLYKKQPAEEILQKILNFKPKGIVSFPSFLLELADIVKNHKPPISLPLFKFAFTSGEATKAHERKIIEKELGCKIYDRYAVTEFFTIGQECEKHDGFHLNSESFIFEIIDDQGQPLRPGNEGKIVVTNLDNEIMPFIRYETGDIGHIVPGACPCGSLEPFFKIKGRRNLPKIWIVQGKRINPFLFYEVFLDQNEIVKYYQARKKNDHHIEIRIVPGKKFIASHLDKLRVKVRHALQNDKILITLLPVEKIPPEPNGKRQDFVDEEELKS